jgi:hypothetical protein
LFLEIDAMAIAAPDLRYRLPGRYILRPSRTRYEDGGGNEDDHPG